MNQREREQESLRAIGSLLHDEEPADPLDETPPPLTVAPDCPVCWCERHSAPTGERPRSSVCRPYCVDIEADGCCAACGADCAPTGERPSGEVPSKLPPTLPVGTRAEAEGASAEALTAPFLEQHERHGAVYWATWSAFDGDGRSFIRARDIDWAHWRAQQAPDPLPPTIPAKTRWRGRWIETLDEAHLRNGRYQFSDNATLDPKLIDWAHWRAHQPSERYVPSVGERAVLVGSPDAEDEGLIDVAVLIVGAAPNSHERLHWHVKHESGAKRYVHRDATWRRAERQGEATRPQLTEAERYAKHGCVGCSGCWGHGPCVKKQPESDAAWLKRTVEELTTARPVGVAAWERAAALNGLSATTAGFEPLLVGAGTIRDRNVGHVSEGLRKLGWPLRRNARPVEPEADPIEALSKRVAEMERDLDRRVDSQSKRLDELERRLRELDPIGSAK